MKSLEELSHKVRRQLRLYADIWLLAPELGCSPAAAKRYASVVVGANAAVRAELPTEELILEALREATVERMEEMKNGTP